MERTTNEKRKKTVDWASPTYTEENLRSQKLPTICKIWSYNKELFPIVLPVVLRGISFLLDLLYKPSCPTEKNYSNRVTSKML